MPGVYMKKLIAISFLLITQFAFAFDIPIFAKLDVDGVSSNMPFVNPRFGLISQAHINIDENAIELTLTKRMPECPLGRLCPQIMPSPVSVYLSIISVIRTECSTKYIAATPGDVEDYLHEEVVVEDFSYTTCELSMKYRASGIITYKVTGISSLTQRTDTAGARFFVNGGFVRPVVQP